MIRLGFNDREKAQAVSAYCAKHSIEKVFLIAPPRFMGVPMDVDVERLELSSIIEYRIFYRMMQEVGPGTLVIVNECLRKQYRSDLAYNCIRNFLLQTEHQIIFQHLPIVDSLDDFMILVDFDTRSRWRLHRWEPGFRGELDLVVKEVPLVFSEHRVEASPKDHERYSKEKRKLIDGIGLRDPHIIPRNLGLFTGTVKARHIDQGAHYVARNGRLRLPNLQTYRDTSFPHEYDVFEFCHNFVDFAEFVALTQQSRFRVMTTDLKVDRWYFDRYAAWAERLAGAYEALHG